MCRVLDLDRVDANKYWCRKIDPESTFREVYRRDGRIELHWSYNPATAFLRLGYDAGRIGKDLAPKDIDLAIARSVQLGQRRGAELSRTTPATAG